MPKKTTTDQPSRRVNAMSPADIDAMNRRNRRARARRDEQRRRAAERRCWEKQLAAGERVVCDDGRGEVLLVEEDDGGLRVEIRLDHIDGGGTAFYDLTFVDPLDPDNDPADPCPIHRDTSLDECRHCDATYCPTCDETVDECGPCRTARVDAEVDDEIRARARDRGGWC